MFELYNLIFKIEKKATAADVTTDANDQSWRDGSGTDGTTAADGSAAELPNALC